MNDPTGSEQLQRQYDRALAEYRFQVDLNWRRSEYFFVLNVGVLIAAATMFSSDQVPQALAGALFLIGALLAILSVFANEAQHGYYRAARDLKSDLEARLELDSLALATTPGMGSRYVRLGRVGTFLKIMLIAIALVDVGGAVFAVDDVVTAGDERVLARTVLLHLESARHGKGSALVVSQEGEAIDARHLPARGGSVLLELPPGKYLISVGQRSLCQQKIEVGSAPLQLLSLPC